MLVSCPKCSSRYQLSDEKVRASGTKVRCPRCQNTFKVFPEKSESEKLDSDRTELFIRREEVLKKPTTPAPTPRNDVTSQSASAESPRTSEAKTGIRPHQAAASVPETVRFTKPREPSPFKRNLAETEAPQSTDWEISKADSSEEETKTATKTQKAAKSPPVDPARSKKVADEMDDSEEATAKAKPEESGPKPFGDATFLAIQKMGGAKEGRRRLIMAAALVALIVAVFLFLTSGPRPAPELAQNDSQKSAVSVELKRPNRWYQDDASVFQRFLGQMATLPRAEQDRPENKALIAEALVLNGLFTGAYDQVAQGMAMASDLMTTHANDSYGFYARATYAFFKDDSSSLMNLVQKWPKANQGDLEYRLAKAVVLAKSGQKTAGLSAAKDLLNESADFKRVQLPILNIALDSSKESDLIFGEKTVETLIREYQKTRENFKSAGTPVPDLLTSIEKKLLRRDVVASSKPSAPAAKQPETRPAKPEPESPAKAEVATKKDEDSITSSLNKRAKQEFEATRKEAQTVASTPTPASEPKAEAPAAPAAPVAKTPTKLPKPSQDLVAANQQAKKEESEAGKLYKQGVALADQNKLEEAILSLQKSLRFDPDYADSYRKLGEIYMKKEEKEKALRSFKIYLQLRPDSSDKQVVESWISSLE